MYYFVDNSFELKTNEYDKNDLLEFRCENCGKLQIQDHEQTWTEKPSGTG